MSNCRRRTGRFERSVGGPCRSNFLADMRCSSSQSGTGFRSSCSTAGRDSSEAMMADVENSFEEMGDAGGPIAESWEQEKTVETEDELRELMRIQLPFHFAGEPPPGYGDDTVFSPEVLRHFANVGYG